jgi:hypothetical protein
VALEQDARLDPAVDTLRRLTASLDGSPAGAALRGEWLGHALHPALTDLPLGMWTATTALDLFGGPDSRPAARRLLGLGLLAAGPTALSGWAEWRRAERPEQRVGLAHAALNATAILLYAGSWTARRRDRHSLGAVLALAGAGASGAAGYLGGHLAAVRKVSSRHPAFGAGESTLDGGTADGVDGRGASEDSATPRPSTADDVRGAIAAQHVRITTMVQHVSTAAPEESAERLRELLAYLAGHEAVEEELIHPLLPVDGEEVGLRRAAEEDGIAQQIENLEQLDVGSPTFTTQFGLIEEALTHHAKAEEVEELPLLSSALNDADASRIVSALAAQEAAAAIRHGSFAEMLESAKRDVRAPGVRHA